MELGRRGVSYTHRIRYMFEFLQTKNHERDIVNIECQTNYIHIILGENKTVTLIPLFILSY